MARNCRHLFPMASHLFLSLALPPTLMWFGVGNEIIIITRKKWKLFFLFEEEIGEETQKH